MSGAARTGRRSIGAAAGLGLLAGLLTGCASTSPAVPLLRSAEQAALQVRALDQLLLAARSDVPVVACNAIEALVQVAPQDGLPQFRQAVASDSPLVRYAGFVALGELRDRSALPQMRAGVRDAHPNVRLAAAFAACRCGRDGYLRILADALNHAADEAVRADAAGLIGRYGDARARQLLRVAQRAKLNEGSNRVRLAICGALARLGDEAGLQQLVLYSRGDTATRTEALLILAELDLHQSREDLLYALAGPKEEYLEARLIAARGLGKLGYHDGYDLAMQMLSYADPNPTPTPDKPDRTFAVRSLAIHALAEIGDTRALPALRDIAATPADPRLQVAASYAICKIVGRTRT